MEPRMTPPPAEPVLQVEGLRTGFSTRAGMVAALDGVSFALGRGERLGIVGESGSGKSSLALSIMGLVPPPGRVLEGTVRLNGHPISTFPDEVMSRVRGRDLSIVFQDPLTALNPVKKVGAQVMEALLVHQPRLGRAAARRRAVELLRSVGIVRPEQRVDDYPHQYSGGMRQRVAIAMALANEPDVLIADEPTTALDATTQAEIVALLERLADSHETAIVLISHNLALVSEFCDRVLIMYAGRVVEQADVPAVFARPAHPYTEALLQAIPSLASSRADGLAAIPGSPPNLLEPAPGCPFEPRCAVGRGKEICRTTKPPAVPVGGGGSFAECHFALQGAGSGERASARDEAGSVGR
jgi:oligopeptide/dipeptide ABC transporter ATP-binding protein